ncbi:MAG: ATP-dependent Clp protease ATP-binding subunit ClpX, partial [Clostridia bacterium]|nr:ATP-dependent Clp protease ATP-binding subunit ClpX [Clostridia bacterium]
GFNSKLRTAERDYAEMVKDIQPDDLIKFGLIPEFVGRLPIVTALNPLDEEALVRILKEPKNALISQYKKLFDMDGVELEFEEEAIRAIARKAYELKTGARGLRTIIENAVLALMYDVPSDGDIIKVTITAETINNKCLPIVKKKSA